MRTSHPMHSIVAAGLAVAAMLVVSGSAQAQFGFSSEMIMDRLDQNDDGRIDADEMAESRMPIANMAQQAGIDASNGLSADDVTKIFEKMQQMREQGGGGGGRGGGGGFGGGGFGGGGRGGRGGFGGGDNGDQTDKSKDKGPVPLPRVTMDLQSAFLPGDANSDGQITMAEWLRWKSRAAMAEFFSIDRNADGILTPHELAKAGTAVPVDLALIFPSAHPAAVSQPAAGLAVAESQPATVDAKPQAEQAKPPAGSEDLERHKADAQRSFKLMDRDNDGSIGDLEWRRSRLLKPKFEAAGADFSKPMSEADFTSYYLKFSTGGE